MLWRINGTDIFFFGSLHLGHPNFYPLPAQTENAFTTAQRVWFEAPTDDTFSRRARCSGIGIFRKLLSFERLADSIEFGKKCGIDPKTVVALRPWALAIIFGNKAWEKEGLTSEYGLERQLEPRARAAGKPIHYFESVNAQLDIYDSAPYDEQNDFLNYILKADGFEERMLMVQAWRTADRSAFDKIVADSIKKFPFYKTLLFERNRAWLPQIRKIVDQQISSFICVGASHLAGVGGLPVLLMRELGCQLEPVV